MIDFEKMAGGTVDEFVIRKVLKSNLAKIRDDPFDIEQAIKPFKKYEIVLAEWKKKVLALVVNDEKTVTLATEMGAQVAGIVKQMEKERKQSVEEPDKFVRGINTFFRRFKGPLESIKTDLKKRIGEYAYLQELERRKKEKAAQKAQRKLQAEMDKAAKKADVAPVVMPEMVAPKKKAPVRSQSGSSSTRYKWTFEVEDVEKIDRKYMAPDEKAIQGAIDAGIRNMPGVRIYEKPIVSIRM